MLLRLICCECFKKSIITAPEKPETSRSRSKIPPKRRAPARRKRAKSKSSRTPSISNTQKSSKTRTPSENFIYKNAMDEPDTESEFENDESDGEWSSIKKQLLPESDKDDDYNDGEIDLEELRLEAVRIFINLI